MLVACRSARYRPDQRVGVDWRVAGHTSAKRFDLHHEQGGHASHNAAPLGAECPSSQRAASSAAAQNRIELSYSKFKAVLRKLGTRSCCDLPRVVIAGRRKNTMISLEDCIAMSGLDEKVVEAIAEHEGIPEISAAALARYLLHEIGGADRIREMI